MNIDNNGPGLLLDQAMNFISAMENIVAQIYVTHHHSRSPWQRTKLLWMYADTGTTEKDWAMVAARDTEIMVLDTVIGSIYSGGPRVDRLSSYLISLYRIHRITNSTFSITWSPLLFLRFRVFIELDRSSWLDSIKSFHSFPILLEPGPLHLTN